MYSINCNLVLQKLAELEHEEALREEAGMYAIPKLEMDDTMMEVRELAQKIRDKKAIMKQDAQLVKNSTKPHTPRTSTAKVRERSVSRLQKQMSDLGVDVDKEEVHIICVKYIMLETIINMSAAACK